MKRLLLLLPLALLAGVFAGCTTVTVDTQGQDMVVIENSGCYLFYVLPIMSGDPNYPNQQVCNWFDDTVKVETNIRVLESTASERGARDIRNIASHRDDETLIPLILKRRVYRTSAELVK